MVAERTRLTTDRIKQLLNKLALRLEGKGLDSRIVVVGGAAVALSARPDREATIDIDVFATITQQIKDVIEEIATEEDLPADWLNARAQQFMSAAWSHADLPILVQTEHVTICVLDEASLLAMKLRAGRAAKDLPDIEALIQSLNVSSLEQAQSIFDQYYGGEETMKPIALQLLERLFHDN